ncbi:PnuC-like nicotinamide mononucleotide transport [Bacillus phage vB_BanS_Sophrita]|uniref:Nicotinamide mononucleotide transporter n=1 Tax=Bacillus phage vB_BanS_Sophrita TaxID=2894790 RepID=A0AAE8YTU4_9CAUD|nr:PnuC-like nicotinamide mononucleotide transport [Bacillus phage vB_BanS_Sophrita]UGO50660.1 nicotinamide mononucleotide transporter [Bacillus phage vB_BanS_Sophrita]
MTKTKHKGVDSMKTLLKGWTGFELAMLTLFTVLSVYMFVAFDDTVVGLTASITGMICVMLVGKGKVSNYFFGIINTALYAYISYKSQLYGEFMLNAFYYFPIQFIGIYLWNKNKSVTDNVVKAKRLTKKGWAYLVATVLGVGVLYGLFLHEIGSQQAGLDGFAVVLSITAQLLMLKRYAEQWLLWIVINVLTIILWFNAFMTDGGSITILIMWCFYLANSIKSWFNWNKFYKQQKNEVM